MVHDLQELADDAVVEAVIAVLCEKAPKRLRAAEPTAFARSTLMPLPMTIQWSKVLRPSERSASRPASTILCSSADRTSCSGCRRFDMTQ